jgi:hypothetical protein
MISCWGGERGDWGMEEKWPKQCMHIWINKKRELWYLKTWKLQLCLFQFYHFNKQSDDVFFLQSYERVVKGANLALLLSQLPDSRCDHLLLHNVTPSNTLTSGQIYGVTLPWIWNLQTESQINLFSSQMCCHWLFIVVMQSWLIQVQDTKQKRHLYTGSNYCMVMLVWWRKQPHFLIIHICGTFIELSRCCWHCRIRTIVGDLFVHGKVINGILKLLV